MQKSFVFGLWSLARITALFALTASGVLAADAPTEETASPAVTSDELENFDRGEQPGVAGEARETRDERPEDRARDASVAGETRETRDEAPADAARRVAGGDRLELDTTVVTGNRELPKVLYIVPWKKADLGELPGQPFNTLLDEVLTPVDRDVFRREVTYFEAVTTSGADANQSTSAPPR